MAENREPPQRLAAIFRALRKNKGISQTVLAEATGIKQPVVSMFENEECTLSGEQIQSIADFLGVDLAKLSAQAETEEPKPRADLRYCENPKCPSNIPFASKGRLYLLPTSAGGRCGPRCGRCGDILLDSCRHCSAEIVQDLTHCVWCGSQYVTPLPSQASEDPYEFSRRERESLNEALSLSERLRHLNRSGGVADE